MSIDWVTLGFNIINFIILMWLLKKFLYKPIVHAMEQREKAVQNRLTDAAAKEEEAKKEAQAYRKKITDFEKKEGSMLADVKREAQKEKEILLKKAQDDLKEKKKKWEAQMDAEREAMKATVANLVSETLISQSRQALKEMADSDLESKKVEVLIKKLPTLEKKEQEKLQSGKTIEIVSSFDLETKTQEKIKTALKEILRESQNTIFKTDKKIICGIELRAGSQIIAWGFDSYIKHFEKELDTALEKLTTSFES